MRLPHTRGKLQHLAVLRSGRWGGLLLRLRHRSAYSAHAVPEFPSALLSFSALFGPTFRIVLIMEAVTASITTLMRTHVIDSGATTDVKESQQAKKSHSANPITLAETLLSL